MATSGHDGKDAPETAAEWLLDAMFKKFEEQFLLIEIKKGVAILKEKMMDAPKVAAMLYECSINSTNARVLFWHLKQFFGRQIAVSEGVWHQYFWGMECLLTTGCYTLEDKIPVFFWCKEPEDLICNIK